MTDSVNVEQCDREAAWPFRHYVYGPSEREAWDRGDYDRNRHIQAFARHRIAERERNAGIAKTGWVSADYNIVGIADAVVAMRLCEHIETAIRALSDD